MTILYGVNTSCSLVHILLLLLLNFFLILSYKISLMFRERNFFSAKNEKKCQLFTYLEMKKQTKQIPE